MSSSDWLSPCDLRMPPHSGTFHCSPLSDSPIAGCALKPGCFRSPPPAPPTLQLPLQLPPPLSPSLASPPPDAANSPLLATAVAVVAAVVAIAVAAVAAAATTDAAAGSGAADGEGATPPDAKPATRACYRPRLTHAPASCLRHSRRWPSPPSPPPLLPSVPPATAAAAPATCRYTPRGPTWLAGVPVVARCRRDGDHSKSRLCCYLCGVARLALAVWLCRRWQRAAVQCARRQRGVVAGPVIPFFP